MKSPAASPPELGVRANYDYWDEVDKDISILLGKGDGTFAPAVPVSNGTYLPSRSIAAADLNDDGIPDLVVVADYDDNFGGAVVSVLIGQSGGEFAPAKEPHSSRKSR